MIFNRRELLLGISASVLWTVMGAEITQMGEGESHQGRLTRIGARAGMLSGMPDPPPDAFNVGVGERLQKLRRARKLTQQDVANFLDVVQGSVSAYENGKTGVSPRHITKLCRLYGITADQLLGMKPIPAEKYQPS